LLLADEKSTCLNRPGRRRGSRCGYRDVYLEKDEPVPAQPSLDELLAREGEEEALSLADFEEEQ
jgi:hypothetical protein